MSLVKDGLAKAWAEHLSEKAEFPFFPHRHDAETVPPFGVVVVKRLRPLVPGEDAHEAEVRIVVVSDHSETTPAQHRSIAGVAYAAINLTPPFGVDLANGVRLCGFAVEDVQQATGNAEDGRKIYSDVFIITAGAAAVS